MSAQVTPDPKSKPGPTASQTSNRPPKKGTPSSRRPK